MVKRNIFSIITALVILYLSLSSSDNFDAIPFLNIPGFDKIAHFGMYFFFMSVIVFENRLNIKYRNTLYLIAIIPAIYGILMELLQALLTNNRTGSFLDMLFNVIGISFSVLLCLVLKPVRKVLFK